MILKDSTKDKVILVKALLKTKSRILFLVRDVTLVVGFSILTGLSSKISVEIGPVPITMQTLAVLLSGAFLGKKKGLVSQISYLLGGLLGLPWFSRGGGSAYVLSPTFGYILGFPLAAYSVGSFFERKRSRDFSFIFLVLLISNFLIYAPGLLILSRFTGFSRLLEIGFYPFLLGDLLKIFLSSFLVLFTLHASCAQDAVRTQDLKNLKR